MKKIAFSLILVIVVTAIFSVNVFAADEYVITFNSVEEYPDILHVDSMEVAIEEDALKLTLTGETHPLFWFGLGAENTKCETPLNASEYKYMKIRYNSAAEDDVLRLFYATYTDLNNNPGPAFTAENMIDLDIKHGAGWQSLIFDMSTLANWKDYISALRFDIDPIMDGAGLTADSAGDEFLVSYIAFFKTEADAKAYKSELDPEEPITTQPVTESNQDTTDAATDKPVESKEDSSANNTDKVSDTASATEKPEEKGGNTGLYIGIGIAIVVIAAIVAVLVVKNKKSK